MCGLLSIIALWAPWTPPDWTARANPQWSLEVAVGLWSHSVEGVIEAQDERTDLKEDLALDTDLDATYALEFTHVIDWLPDVGFEITPIIFEGNLLLEEQFTFEHVVFSEGDRVATGLDLILIDLSLFWRPLRHRYVELRTGALLRHLQGETYVRSTTRDSEGVLDLDAPIIPMLELGVESAPLEWLSVQLLGRGVFFGGSSWFDLSAELRGYISPPALFVTLGYRHQTIALKDLGAADEGEATVGGLTASLGLKF